MGFRIAGLMRTQDACLQEVHLCRKFGTRDTHVFMRRLQTEPKHSQKPRDPPFYALLLQI